MVVQDDVEIVACGGIVADSNVAAVGVAVEWSVWSKDHGIEDAGEGCGDFVSVYVVLVEVGKVVEAMAGDVFHYYDTALSPKDRGYDERTVVQGLEVGFGVCSVVAFEGEVEFLWKGDGCFVGEPGQVVFGKDTLESAEGEAGEGEVERCPVIEHGMLDFDSYSLTRGFVGCEMYLGEGCCAERGFGEVAEEVGERLLGIFLEHCFDVGKRGDGAFVLEWDEGIAPFRG